MATNRLWRWHFFAALFIAPLLLTLTLSGIGYLYYTNVENQLYSAYFFEEGTHTEHQSIDDGIKDAQQQFDGYTVSKVILLEEPYNMRLTMMNAVGDQKYVFLNAHHQIVGAQNAATTYSNVMRNIHSSLFIGGTVVNYLVELAACWAIFLLLTGIYMTVHKKTWRKASKETPRLKKRRFHSIIGILITIPMVVIIFTGLPWSAFMGNIIYTASQAHPSIGTPTLQSHPPTSETNEIPWATRKQQAPASGHEGHGNMAPAVNASNPNALSIEQLSSTIAETSIKKPYSIILPSTDDGVYTVAKGSNTGITGLDVAPSEEMTSYFDQYSGQFISAVGYEDYGILAKWFTWGIPLHEGHLFGWPNKVLNTIVCLAFLFVIYSGFNMWWLRRKKKTLSAPPASPAFSIPFITFLIILGLLMPLFGLSLIVIIFIESFIWLRNRKTV